MIILVVFMNKNKKKLFSWKQKRIKFKQIKNEILRKFSKKKQLENAKLN